MADSVGDLDNGEVDTTEGPAMTPESTLVAAARRRSALEKAMQQLEHTAASPARSLNWIGDLAHRARQLDAALNRHIAEVEAPRGLLDQIVEIAPRLQREVDEIEADHHAIREGIAALLELLDEAERVGSYEPRPIRDAVLGVLEQLTRHRNRGADLVYDAYDVDIGGY